MRAACLHGLRGRAGEARHSHLARDAANPAPAFLQEIYNRVGDNIVLILTGNPDNPKPEFGKLDDVIKTAQRPRGIPAWKVSWADSTSAVAYTPQLFYFTFWADGVETPTGPLSWCMLAESGVPKNVTVSVSRGKALVHTEFDKLRVWTTEGDMPGGYRLGVRSPS